MYCESFFFFVVHYYYVYCVCGCCAFCYTYLILVTFCARMNIFASARANKQKKKQHTERKRMCFFSVLLLLLVWAYCVRAWPCVAGISSENSVRIELAHLYWRFMCITHTHILCKCTHSICCFVRSGRESFHSICICFFVVAFRKMYSFALEILGTFRRYVLYIYIYISIFLHCYARDGAEQCMSQCNCNCDWCACNVRKYCQAQAHWTMNCGVSGALTICSTV